jgi:hypothetical protein
MPPDARDFAGAFSSKCESTLSGFDPQAFWHSPAKGDPVELPFAFPPNRRESRFQTFTRRSITAVPQIFPAAHARPTQNLRHGRRVDGGLMGRRGALRRSSGRRHATRSVERYDRRRRMSDPLFASARPQNKSRTCWTISRSGARISMSYATSAGVTLPSTRQRDIYIARRSMTIARLARVISERAACWIDLVAAPSSIICHRYGFRTHSGVADSPFGRWIIIPACVVSLPPSSASSICFWMASRTAALVDLIPSIRETACTT